MKGLIVRILLLVTLSGMALYHYVKGQNQLMAIRLQIPKLEEEVKKIQEAAARNHYEIEQFENPLHLLEEQRRPEFGHLKQPELKDVVILEESAP